MQQLLLLAINLSDDCHTYPASCLLCLQRLDMGNPRCQARRHDEDGSKGHLLPIVHLSTPYVTRRGTQRSGLGLTDVVGGHLLQAIDCRPAVGRRIFRFKPVNLTAPSELSLSVQPVCFF